MSSYHVPTSIVFDKDVYKFLEQEAAKRGMVTPIRGANITRITNALLRDLMSPARTLTDPPGMYNVTEGAE